MKNLKLMLVSILAIILISGCTSKTETEDAKAEENTEENSATTESEDTTDVTKEEDEVTEEDQSESSYEEVLTEYATLAQEAHSEIYEIAKDIDSKAYVEGDKYSSFLNRLEETLAYAINFLNYSEEYPESYEHVKESVVNFSEAEENFKNHIKTKDMDLFFNGMESFTSGYEELEEAAIKFRDAKE